MLSKRDKKIISLISRDIPLVQEPFKKMALALGIEQEVLFARIKNFKKNGFMRKFSASLNHKKIGFQSNAMVVWNIPPRRVVQAGRWMASLPQVSHCYERKKRPDWNYNVYSMIHGRTRKECLDVVKGISKKITCTEYRALFSSHEYKKTAAKF